jgi:hypothetical protein
MTAELRGGPTLRAGLRQILASRREELLAGFAKPSASPNWLLLVKECRLATDEEVFRDETGLHWAGDLTSDLYDAAASAGTGIVLVHAHGGAAGAPKLSRPDLLTADELLGHFGHMLPDVAHCYAVVNGSGVAGWVQWGDERRTLTQIRAVSTPIAYWSADPQPSPYKAVRGDRQVKALGKAGVAALRAASVGLVGLGGAGSQVAEMLAHAGVGNVVLAEADVVKKVNLNRTHGTTLASVGRLKVRVARDMINAISPTTNTVPIAEMFPTPKLVEHLRDVSVIVSCVDDLHARDELNRFALRFGVPLIDLGTTITQEPFGVDGHVSSVMPEGHCLWCAGHVSDHLLAVEGEAARRGKYGVGGQPQVVSFNGLLAGAAVNELLKIVTGYAGELVGSRELYYDGVSGELQRVMISPAGCPQCSWYSFRGDHA